jgi:hypothetical protein
MTFKNLNIDRNKIDETIQRWAGLDSKPEPLKKGAGAHYCITKDGREIRLIMYFKNDGTTSIDPTAGKNREISKELAEYIKDKCLITDRKSFSLSFKDVSDEDFSLLLEFLTKELEANVTEDNRSDIRRLLRVKGRLKDEIVITYYNNKTVLVQGKPLNLYIEIKLFFYEILSFEQVVKTESDTYKVDLNVAEIRHELESYLPTAFSFLDDRLIRILTPSLSLAKLDIQMEDYSSFAFPALRGLEGYIRQLLKFKGNDGGVKNANKLGSLFKEDVNDYSWLQDFAKSDIDCDATCSALEKSYNFWKSKRHPYFHVDRHIQMTPIIWNKGDAETIIHEALTLIEETYSQIIL